MSITTRAKLLAGERLTCSINKTAVANQSLGTFFSYWTAAGVPGAGSNPTSAAVVDGTLTGVIPFATPVSGNNTYVAEWSMMLSQAATMTWLHDRLAHMGGLDGTNTGAQTVSVDVTGSTSNINNRRGSSDYSEVQWWVECYADLGATPQTASIGVTYDDGSSDTISVSIPATMRKGRVLPFVSNTAGRYIKIANTLTLGGSTGTAGNFGVTATRFLSDCSTANPSEVYRFDWAKLGLARVYDSAALVLIASPSSTGGNLIGMVKLVQG